METTVLRPVRRRRRRRRLVWRRFGPLLLLLALSLALGIVVGSRGHAAPQAPEAAAAPAPKRSARPSIPARTAIVPLLHGPVALRGTALPVLAPAAILVDRTSGRVLWAKRPHERRQVASTTKIMTALLALRRLAPHDVVTVDRSVPRVPLVREGLRAGERVEAWKLFHGLLLYSGNDDALALAIAAAGSRPAFVHAMNAEARRLRLRDTHFRSPSGVEDRDNYSSAWDLAALTRVAMRNERFRELVRTKRKQVPWAAPTYSKIYVNKNLMLTRYPGADGVKTGYTSRAGHCLVATATRHGHALIAVVLDSPDMYADATRLLDLGFGSL
jgi:D-alanyl-D-alanine carboxypeptidase (penicillin-binding protein 5/6)